MVLIKVIKLLFSFTEHNFVQKTHLFTYYCVNKKNVSFLIECKLKNIAEFQNFNFSESGFFNLNFNTFALFTLLCPSYLIFKSIFVLKVGKSLSKVVILYGELMHVGREKLLKQGAKSIVMQTSIVF